MSTPESELVRVLRGREREKKERTGNGECEFVWVFSE